MENIIAIAVILVIVIGAALYIRKAGKRGKTCIGCPHADRCKKNHCDA